MDSLHKFAIVLALIIPGAGCGDAPMVAPTFDANFDDPCSSIVSASWDNYGENFIRNYCRGCHSSQLAPDDRHGAPPSVNLETLEDVHMRLERIEDRATGEDPDMPPGGGPTEEERRRLADWLSCGAP